MAGPKPWGDESYRRDVERVLRQDAEALVAFVHTGLLATDAPQGEHLRPVIRQAVTLLLRGILGDSDDLDGSLWHRIGAGLAAHVDTRAVLIDRFETGTRRAWAFILQRTATVDASSTDSGNLLLDLWNRLDSLREPALTHLLAGYDERRRQQLGGVGGPREQVVDSVLDGTYDDADELALSAKRIGVDLAAPHGLLVVTTTPGREGLWAEAVGACEALTKGCIVGAPRSQPCRHVPVLVPSATGAAWEAVLRRARRLVDRLEVTLLAVQPVEPLGRDRAFERCYRMLLRRALVAVVASSRPAVLGIADVDYHWLLTRAPVEDRADFVRAVLGPVLETPRGTELLDLLDALYETRDGYTGAARVLGKHRNTVDMWRKRLTDLTGLSLDVPADAHRLFTASRLSKMLDYGVLGLRRPS